MGYILGVSPAHDKCFTLLDRRGNPIFALEEERFSRIKHAGYWPLPSTAKALEYGLSRWGIEARSIDVVATQMRTDSFPDQPAASRGRKVLEMLLNEWGLGHAELVEVGHHDAHAASAYYPSPWLDAAILTVDGIGEHESTAWHRGHNSIVERIPVQCVGSLGFLYAGVTRWLGLGHTGAEGKTMALASYGKPTLLDLFESAVLDVNDDPATGYVVRSQIHENGYHVEAFEDLFGPRRPMGKPLTDYHCNVAASLQCALERVLLSMARKLQIATGCSVLCLAGGVALNSAANGALLRTGGWADVFVQPMANDAGTALGAALWVHYARGARRDRSSPWWHMDPYLGADFTDDDVIQAARQFGLTPQIVQPAQHAAALLAAGDVVGWFQGRSEVGPRALGNRSILANPTDAQQQRRINAKVKGREPWRPFAPAILESSVEEWLTDPCRDRFMTTVVRFKTEKQGLVPAVVHVDGTARAQVVSADHAPLFYDVLHEFAATTGIPMLLNTSFNIDGEPIVNTPREALRDFLVSDMDHVILGRYCFSKPVEVHMEVQRPNSQLEMVRTLADGEGKIGLLLPARLLRGFPQSQIIHALANIRLSGAEVHLLAPESCRETMDSGAFGPWHPADDDTLSQLESVVPHGLKALGILIHNDIAKHCDAIRAMLDFRRTTDGRPVLFVALWDTLALELTDDVVRLVDLLSGRTLT